MRMPLATPPAPAALAILVSLLGSACATTPQATELPPTRLAPQEPAAPPRVGLSSYTDRKDLPPAVRAGVVEAADILAEAFATPTGVARHFMDEREVADYAAQFSEWKKEFNVINEVTQLRHGGSLVAREPFEPTLCHYGWDFVGKGFLDDPALAPLAFLVWHRYRFFDDHGHGATLHFLSVVRCDDETCEAFARNKSASHQRTLLLGPPVMPALSLDQLIDQDRDSSVDVFFAKRPDGWVPLEPGTLKAQRARRAEDPGGDDDE